MNYLKDRKNENIGSPNEEVIDITNVNYEFTIDDNLFTENRGDWVMNDFNIKENKCKRKNSRPLQKYYSKQKELIDQFAKIDEMLECIRKGEDYSYNELDSQSFRARVAITVSFAVNVVLLIIKAITLFRTSSLAVLTSLVDSMLDLLSGGVLYICNRAISKVNLLNYPTGMQRLEPLSVIIFSCITACSSIEIVKEAIGNLANNRSSNISMDWIDILLLGAVIISKFILWCWCKSIHESESAQALAQDHGNDILFNIVTTIIAVIASKTVNFIDPVGAIILSVYIIYNWIQTALYYIRMMTGTTASPDEIQKLTYLACRFDTKVIKVDTVRAYHVGVKLYVEVDIVLDRDVPLAEAHDVGECLQELIEKFPEVERAFVHLDYEYLHHIEHNKKNTNITSNELHKDIKKDNQKNIKTQKSKESLKLFSRNSEKNKQSK